MIPNDYADRVVLVTGGTRGIGLATGLAFGRLGAQVYLTHKWGTSDEDQIRRQFSDAGAPVPYIVEADVAEDEDTARLMEQIRGEQDALEVLVSNVSFAHLGKGDVPSYKKRSLMTTLGYSAWPLVGYMQQAHRTFGRYPRYVVGTSSDGADSYYPGYDFVAASKAVLETLCRYLATHLLEQDTRVNVVRARPVSTDSLRATFGDEFEPFLRKYGDERFMIDVEQVADAVLAVCSGWMDAVSGEVILLDRGVAFCDNLMRLFEDRDKYGL